MVGGVQRESISQDAAAVREPGRCGRPASAEEAGARRIHWA